MTFTTFHNNADQKAELIKALIIDKAEERFVQQRWWIDGKGCQMGCVMQHYFPSTTSESIDRHCIQDIHIITGVPVLILRLMEQMFESLPIAEARSWAIESWEAIPVGVNLDTIAIFRDLASLLLRVSQPKPSDDPTTNTLREAFSEVQRLVASPETSRGQWAKSVKVNSKLRNSGVDGYKTAYIILRISQTFAALTNPDPDAVQYAAEALREVVEYIANVQFLLNDSMKSDDCSAIHIQFTNRFRKLLASAKSE